MKNNKQLNTANPEYIDWQYAQLQFTLLGGIDIEGLDRMRVTVKVEWKNNAVRHNLDLYNDSAVDKLVKRCGERFGLGTVFIQQAFALLINELEAYRLQELNKLAVEKQTAKQLTSQERKQAEQFLKSPGLLLRTNDLIGKSGVIGEENNRLLMYLVFTVEKESSLCM